MTSFLPDFNPIESRALIRWVASPDDVTDVTLIEIQMDFSSHRRLIGNLQEFITAVYFQKLGK